MHLGGTGCMCWPVHSPPHCCELPGSPSSLTSVLELIPQSKPSMEHQQCEEAVASHSCVKRSSAVQFPVDPVSGPVSTHCGSEGLALSPPCGVRSLHSRWQEEVAEGDEVSWNDDCLPSALSSSPPLVASPEQGRSSATICAWPPPPAVPAVLRKEKKKKQTEEECLRDGTSNSLIFNLKCFSVPHGSFFEFLKAPSVAAPSGLLSGVTLVSFFSVQSSSFFSKCFFFPSLAWALAFFTLCLTVTLTLVLFLLLSQQIWMPG